MSASVVGEVSPGSMTRVFAACCWRCARVELLADLSAGRDMETGSSRSKAAALLRERGWRHRPTDLEQFAWECPDCRPAAAEAHAKAAWELAEARERWRREGMVRP